MEIYKMNLIFLNLVMLILCLTIYFFLKTYEDKSMFFINTMSNLWLYYVMPITGFLFNMMGFISSSEKFYILASLVYIAVMIVRLCYQGITAKLDSLYYKKNMPIIQKQLDEYIGSLDIENLKGYEIHISRNSYSNSIILKVEYSEDFDKSKYKNEVELMLKNYNVRVSYERT